jgi:hypothetical protein
MTIIEMRTNITFTVNEGALVITGKVEMDNGISTVEDFLYILDADNCGGTVDFRKTETKGIYEFTAIVYVD